MPNRELDVWLAERLDLRACSARHDGATCSAAFAAHPAKVLPVSLAHDFEPLPLSSTGDGMLLVLEAMRERGYTVDLNTGGQAFRWAHVMRATPRAFEQWDHISADSLPMAVALAAKAALGSLSPVQQEPEASL